MKNIIFPAESQIWLNDGPSALKVMDTMEKHDILCTFM